MKSVDSVTNFVWDFDILQQTSSRDNLLFVQGLDEISLLLRLISILQNLIISETNMIDICTIGTQSEIYTSGTQSEICISGNSIFDTIFITKSIKI